MIGACFSFLPVLGPELFPLGLMLLAHDVKSLRRPAGELTMWLLDRHQRILHSLLLLHARWTAWSTCVVAGTVGKDNEEEPAREQIEPLR
jgi:hypothetical protein